MVEKKNLLSISGRTKKLAVRIIRLYGSLPKTSVAQVLGKQLLRSGTSVGAHFREASRARSNAEFISKIEVGLQELDESLYWMELLLESEIFPKTKLADLMQETDELIAILATCAKNAKARGKKSKA